MRMPNKKLFWSRTIKCIKTRITNCTGLLNIPEILKSAFLGVRRNEVSRLDVWHACYGNKRSKPSPMTGVSSYQNTGIWILTTYPFIRICISSIQECIVMALVHVQNHMISPIFGKERIARTVTILVLLHMKALISFRWSVKITGRLKCSFLHQIVRVRKPSPPNKPGTQICSGAFTAASWSWYRHKRQTCAIIFQYSLQLQFQ